MTTSTNDNIKPVNEQALRDAIAIMRRAKRLRMNTWQAPVLDDDGEEAGPIVTTEDELHSCGNSACFAGHVGVSDEWIDAGGSISPSGMPVILLDDAFSGGSMAIWRWMGGSSLTIHHLIHGDTVDGWSRFYDKPWKDVVLVDVIVKLEEMLADHLAQQVLS